MIVVSNVRKERADRRGSSGVGEHQVVPANAIGRKSKVGHPTLSGRRCPSELLIEKTNLADAIYCEGRVCSISYRQAVAGPVGSAVLRYSHVQSVVARSNSISPSKVDHLRIRR